MSLRPTHLIMNSYSYSIKWDNNITCCELFKCVVWMCVHSRRYKKRLSSQACYWYGLTMFVLGPITTQTWSDVWCDSSTLSLFGVLTLDVHKMQACERNQVHTGHIWSQLEPDPMLSVMLIAHCWLHWWAYLDLYSDNFTPQRTANS